YNLFLKQGLPTLRNNNLSKDDTSITLLIKHAFNPLLRKGLADAVANSMNGYIYSTQDSEEAATPRSITFRNIETGEQGDLFNRELISLSAAQKRLIEEVNAITNLTNEERELAINMLRPLLMANLHYSEALTNVARAVARLQVAPVNINFRQNQIIARHGD